MEPEINNDTGIMGETMKHKWGILVAMSMTVAMSMACNGNDTTPTAQPTPTAAQQKHVIMENAYANGETVFLYDAPQNTRYALFCGDERIVFLKPYTLRTVKLTSNECLNLSVRALNGDGDWTLEYSFQPIASGDYVFFNGSSWRVTPYTP